MDDDLFDAFDDADDGHGKRGSSGVSGTEPSPVSKRPRPDEEAPTVSCTATSSVAAATPGVAAVEAPTTANAPSQLATSLEDQTTKVCRHEVAMPMGSEPTEAMLQLTLPADAMPPAREYKFELDPFQKAAVGCIERDESVLVSAHTSAGKTVCAEYAIATSLRAGQRVLYTSPIKALSNQKYRELKEEFVDVGLMTGDVTIDVNSTCLVMTTEILRSMLYRGSEVMREVKWVIFDEVHYMRDKERGVVWEEVMILLPKSVRFVFLSACATHPSALSTRCYFTWRRCGGTARRRPARTSAVPCPRPASLVNCASVLESRGRAGPSLTRWSLRSGLQRCISSHAMWCILDIGRRRSPISSSLTAARACTS